MQTAPPFVAILEDIARAGAASVAEPAPRTTSVARRLLDIAERGCEIGVEIGLATEILIESWQGFRDKAQGKAGALTLMYSVREGVAALIAEIEGIA